MYMLYVYHSQCMCFFHLNLLPANKKKEKDNFRLNHFKPTDVESFLFGLDHFDKTNTVMDQQGADWRVEQFDGATTTGTTNLHFNFEFYREQSLMM